MNPETLATFLSIFAIMTGIAAVREHWSEFNLFLFISFISVFGLVVSLL